MNNLLIEETEDTPKIDFNTNTNIFEISGRSYPDNVFVFYKPIFDWLNDYFSNSVPLTKFNIKLDYFNTASAKILFDILSFLDQRQSDKKSIEIAWFYKKDDDDMREAGEGYKKLIKTPIEVISID